MKVWYIVFMEHEAAAVALGELTAMRRIVYNVINIIILYTKNVNCLQKYKKCSKYVKIREVQNQNTKG